MQATGMFALPALLPALAFVSVVHPARAQDASAAGRQEAFLAPAQVSTAPLPESEPTVTQVTSAEVSTETPKRSFFGQFIDEEDKGLDFSNFLAKGGFVPIPIFISEPAVDGGFGLAAAFLATDPERPRQITKTAAAAFKTGNGSNGYLFFRSGYAFDGRLNYRIGIAHANITLDTFPPFAPQGVQYTNHYDYGVLGSAFWHLRDDRFFFGPIIDFRKLRSQLDIAGLPPDFAKDFNRKLQTGALGFGVHFDSRDNPLTPTTGVNAFAEAKFNRGAFGSDRDYESYAVETYAFGKFSSNLRFGLKFDLKAIRGDFPSYFAPYIELRGVQAVQFQGENVLSSEAEMTWQISPRWSLLAFGGVGTTEAGSRRVFADSGAIWAGGAGFRYRIARKLGLDMGVDVAYGPDGTVFYLQFGHAWGLGMD
jgi:hypothetical protein